MAGWLERNINRIKDRERELEEERIRKQKEELRLHQEQEQIRIDETSKGNRRLLETLERLNARGCLEDINTLTWDGVGTITIDDLLANRGRMGIELSFEYPRYSTYYSPASGIFDSYRSASTSHSVKWVSTMIRVGLVLTLLEVPALELEATYGFDTDSYGQAKPQFREHVSDVLVDSPESAKVVIEDFLGKDILRRQRSESFPLQLAKKGFVGINKGLLTGSPGWEERVQRVQSFIDSSPIGTYTAPEPEWMRTHTAAPYRESPDNW